jgi:hypothetical protein
MCSFDSLRQRQFSRGAAILCIERGGWRHRGFSPGYETEEHRTARDQASWGSESSYHIRDNCRSEASTHVAQSPTWPAFARRLTTDRTASSYCTSVRKFLHIKCGGFPSFLHNISSVATMTQGKASVPHFLFLMDGWSSDGYSVSL